MYSFVVQRKHGSYMVQVIFIVEQVQVVSPRRFRSDVPRTLKKVGRWVCWIGWVLCFALLASIHSDRFLRDEMMGKCEIVLLCSTRWIVVWVLCLYIATLLVLVSHAYFLFYWRNSTSRLNSQTVQRMLDIHPWTTAMLFSFLTLFTMSFWWIQRTRPESGWGSCSCSMFTLCYFMLMLITDGGWLFCCITFSTLLSFHLMVSLHCSITANLFVLKKKRKEKAIPWSEL